LRRLAIFCDGTWNKPENAEQTHVERLSAEIPSIGADGVAQVPQYFEGVGSGRGTTWLARTLDQVGGGAFGWGLTAKIEKAYRWLAEHYRPGDEIYIFGFSRGAYTARSLGGLIRASGIPTAKNVDRIPDALKRYRDRDPVTEPKTDQSAEFRWGFAPHVHTGEEERQWRIRNGHPEGAPLSIAYLGIWDTVGSLGVPGVLGAIAKPFNARYLFHDAALSRSVRAGRHAISTDERRLFYPPTIWQNLDILNGGDPNGPYRQEWFPGDHGMVGGSGANKQLSEYAMDWVLDGAEAAGLEIRAGFRAEVKAGRLFGGPLSNKRRRLFGRARRVGKHSRDVSGCSLHRLAFGDERGRDYDPQTLQPLKTLLAPRLPGARDPDFP